MSDAREIKRLLEAAFLGVQRDEDCTLHQAQLADQSLSRKISREEWAAAGRLDPETDWRDVPTTALDECPEALSHATPPSWHFYLPAYMRHALDLIETPTWESIGSVIFHLTYSEKNNLGPYHLQRFRQLNEAQSWAVTAFLEFLRDYPNWDPFFPDDAKLALRKYWGLAPERRPPGLKIIRS